MWENKTERNFILMRKMGVMSQRVFLMPNSKGDSLYRKLLCLAFFFFPKLLSYACYSLKGGLHGRTKIYEREPLLILGRLLEAINHR